MDSDEFSEVCLEVHDPSKPLRGAVICSTSIAEEKRTQLTANSEQMGAAYRADLTLEVTHLVVGNYKTPKYTYVAKERGDIRPMKLEWIDAVRELWIHDKELDMEALEREYALPTFESLRISMTGCDDPMERQNIAQQVTAHGARYEGDLTKQITHLISFRTEGAKYKAARSWGINVVSPEWLWDSLERGMILDEKLYDPTLPIEERGKDAWNRSTSLQRSILGKRPRRDSGVGSEGKRKLRRTASTRINSQSRKMWGDIIGAAPCAQNTQSRPWEEAAMKSTGDKSRLTSAEDLGSPRLIEPISFPETSKHGMFTKCHFYLHGFNARRTKILQDYLMSNGATITASLEDLSSDNGDYLLSIIPSDLPISEHPQLPPNSRVEIITEWWVERCLHHKSFAEPREHIIGRPLANYPLEGFQDVKITLSAFSGIDLLHVVNITKLLGALYSEELTPRTTVLVTNSSMGLRKDKLQHAQKWSIPIVSAKWLWDSIEAGQRLPFDGYHLRGLKQGDSRPASKDACGDSFTNGVRSKSNSAEATLKPGSQKRLNTVGAQAVAEQGDATNTKAPVTKTRSIKKEFLFENKNAPAAVYSDKPTKTPPLSEISPNSPCKPASNTISASTAPITRMPTAQEQEVLDSVLTNLLAANKTRPNLRKTSSGASGDSAPVPRKRENRIRGRIPSNLSASASIEWTESMSRATSVDSTATHGNCEENPQCNDYAKSRISLLGPKNSSVIALENFMRGDRQREPGEDSQPLATQVSYVDPESEVQRERVMAKLRGENIERTGKGKAAEKGCEIGGGRALTVGSGVEFGGKRGRKGKTLAGLR